MTYSIDLEIKKDPFIYPFRMQYFIGVDVGTGSVRAALVQKDGKIVATAKKEITIWNPKPNFYQQSAANIWNAVIFTIKVPYVC